MSAANDLITPTSDDALAMLLDEIKRLVTAMREVADGNTEQARLARSATGRSHHEGRADAYNLSAGWLEKLILTEITEETTNDMITGDDARALVAHLHRLADNSREMVRCLPVDNGWRMSCNFSAKVYNLAAELLEELIPKEAKQ